MENKRPSWVTRTIYIGSVVSIPAFYLTHDCEIVNSIKVDKQIGIGIPINNNLNCNHKHLIAGLTNTATPSGDFIDCPVDV